jgi:hypothetical protein
MTATPTTAAATGAVNVLVHGLIFMRLSAGQTYLELVVPKLTEASDRRHHFFIGATGALQEQSTGTVVDWRDIGLTGSPAERLNPGQLPSNLKKSVLQFSISTTGLEGWNSAYEGGKVLLRWPKRFSSIRCDYFDRAFLYYDDTTAPKVIGNAIKQNCRGKDPNAKIGLVTCLEYTYDPASGVNVPGWQPGINLHCYFEPFMKHSIDDVNEDLGQAAQLFQYPANFDLQMLQAAGTVITNPGEPCADPPSGIQQGDDSSLGGDLESPFSALKKNSSSPKNADHGVNPFMVNVSPANCPSFFVGP